ncbi:MAG: CBS domain-containing protein [Vicinamibacterales bacterium]
MTPDPACCSPHTTLDDVAKLMAQHDCGEIPIIDMADHPIGVITDRDIVCRVVADGKNPGAHTAEQYMTRPVVTVHEDWPLDQVVSTMASHRLHRTVVVDDEACCIGIVALADVARVAEPPAVVGLVRALAGDDPHA